MPMVMALVFVTVKVCAAEVAVIPVSGKAAEVGEMDAVVSSPVPPSAAVSVELPVDEFGTVSTPVREPAAVGVKITLIVHVPPTAIVPVQVFAVIE